MKLFNATTEIAFDVYASVMDRLCERPVMSVLWIGLVTITGAWVLGQVIY